MYEGDRRSSRATTAPLRITPLAVLILQKPKGKKNCSFLAYELSYRWNCHRKEKCLEFVFSSLQTVSKASLLEDT